MPNLESCVFFGYVVVIWAYTIATLWVHPSLEYP